LSVGASRSTSKSASDSLYFLPAPIHMKKNPLALYILLLILTVGVFSLIRYWGEALPVAELDLDAVPSGSVAAQQKVDAGRSGDALLHVLLALASVIVAGRAFGWLLARAGQPPVIGEVVAGIVLGPSLLGRVAPDISGFVLPPSVAPFLGVIAQLGVVLYMFLVGLEFDSARLRHLVHTSVAIAHASIVVPFLLGSFLALRIYSELAPSGVPFTSFALFMGISLAVTAFPVLARILSDRGMTRSELGMLALGCAAADDVTAWCLLAFVVGVTQAKLESALWVCVFSLLYIAIILVVVRPVAKRLARRFDDNDVNRNVVAGVLLALLVSALATEVIGIHAVFGAFLLGAVIPHDCAITRVLTRQMEDLVTVLLLPAFFAFTGMRTQIGLVAGWNEWLICGLIILVATAGKFGGTLLAARLAGLGWRMSAALGILMNTRGLMGLIVLNIGLELGVISPTLFAMMVIMALVTTLATTPILHFLGAAHAPAH
jgi:Kef-type K+ transport system membrane component KefB